VNQDQEQRRNYLGSGWAPWNATSGVQEERGVADIQETGTRDMTMPRIARVWYFYPELWSKRWLARVSRLT
jgi:hypothetical protein